MKIAKSKKQSTKIDSTESDRQSGSSNINLPKDADGELSQILCRSILCKNGETYTDEEIILIRRTLYALAEIDYKFHHEQRTKQTLNPSAEEDHDQQESYPLYPGVHRRAS